MTDQIKTIVSWLGALGLPSIFAMTVHCIKECNRFSKQLRILHAAQKAQMRSQLLEQYYLIRGRGYVYSDELDDWINQYNAYHELVGENGVLDNRKAELCAYPSQVR